MLKASGGVKRVLVKFQQTIIAEVAVRLFSNLVHLHPRKARMKMVLELFVTKHQSGISPFEM